MSNVNDIVKMLNHALKIDPAAVKAVFETRVQCNDALADDPYIVARHDNTVSPISFINGVLNLLGEDRVALVLDTETDELCGFANPKDFQSE